MKLVTVSVAVKDFARPLKNVLQITEQLRYSYTLFGTSRTK
ncbi:hypothetical protein F510_0655 [Anoxybacillus gonensis]|nr:hypothetical protein F510_0655 [Anoxybacillus gonensis]